MAKVKGAKEKGTKTKKEKKISKTSPEKRLIPFKKLKERLRTATRTEGLSRALCAEWRRHGDASDVRELIEDTLLFGPDVSHDEASRNWSRLLEYISDVDSDTVDRWLSKDPDGRMLDFFRYGNKLSWDDARTRETVEKWLVKFPWKERQPYGPRGGNFDDETWNAMFSRFMEEMSQYPREKLPAHVVRGIECFMGDGFLPDDVFDDFFEGLVLNGGVRRGVKSALGLVSRTLKNMNAESDAEATASEERALSLARKLFRMCSDLPSESIEKLARKNDAGDNVFVSDVGEFLSGIPRRHLEKLLPDVADMILETGFGERALLWGFREETGKLLSDDMKRKIFELSLKDVSFPFVLSVLESPGFGHLRREFLEMAAHAAAKAGKANRRSLGHDGASILLQAMSDGLIEVSGEDFISFVDDSVFRNIVDSTHADSYGESSLSLIYGDRISIEFGPDRTVFDVFTEEMFARGYSAPVFDKILHMADMVRIDMAEYDAVENLKDTFVQCIRKVPPEEIQYILSDAKNRAARPSSSSGVWRAALVACVERASGERELSFRETTDILRKTAAALSDESLTSNDMELVDTLVKNGAEMARNMVEKASSPGDFTTILETKKLSASAKRMFRESGFSIAGMSKKLLSLVEEEKRGRENGTANTENVVSGPFSSKRSFVDDATHIAAFLSDSLHIAQPERGGDDESLAQLFEFLADNLSSAAHPGPAYVHLLTEGPLLGLDPEATARRAARAVFSSNSGDEAEMVFSKILTYATSTNHSSVEVSNRVLAEEYLSAAPLCSMDDDASDSLVAVTTPRYAKVRSDNDRSAVLFTRVCEYAASSDCSGHLSANALGHLVSSYCGGYMSREEWTAAAKSLSTRLLRFGTREAWNEMGATTAFTALAMADKRFVSEEGFSVLEEKISKSRSAAAANLLGFFTTKKYDLPPPLGLPNEVLLGFADVFEGVSPLAPGKLYLKGLFETLSSEIENGERDDATFEAHSKFRNIVLKKVFSGVSGLPEAERYDDAFTRLLATKTAAITSGDDDVPVL